MVYYIYYNPVVIPCLTRNLVNFLGIAGQARLTAGQYNDGADNKNKIAIYSGNIINNQ